MAGSKIAEIAKKEGALAERSRFLEKREKGLDGKEKELARLIEERVELLQKAANLTAEEAKTELLAELDKKLVREKARRIRAAEERIKEEGEETAREILVEAMRHGVTDYVAEYTVSMVRLADEETKGRIIGKEGRNIRAFEQATGVEMELDEGVDIRLSCFDSVRREIARRALEKLIRDTRIQPARIEEVVAQQAKQMDQVLLEEGKKIAHECGVYDLPLELLRLIGRYKFRFSYGQNLGLHTIEETKIGVAIANEVKADVKTVRLGCLLHDIGKVVEEEGTHVEAGVGVLRRFGLPDEVVACVAEHHEDKPFSSLESVIVFIADAISGSRPGARYEPHEEYVKRMEKIEEIARGFEGVEEAYAFQAGRDLRVVVAPDKVNDDEATVLAAQIADKLSQEAEYAGQIKVTVIREVRASQMSVAK